MQAEDSFDAFYLATRQRLLEQAFALTGDLPAAQTAVRDAYVAAWHHWRKVSRLEDREAWVRPLAWNLAQRRHAGRIWHRGRGIDPEHRAVLDALTKLPTPQRRTLLLVQLAGTSIAAAAREVGVSEATAARHLQTATAAVSSRLEVEPAAMRLRLLALTEPPSEAGLPGAAVVRAAGRRRRRVHTLVAAAAVTAVAVSSGAVAHQPVQVPQVREKDRPATAVPAEAEDPDTEPSAGDMLDEDQIRRLGPRQLWKVSGTHNNTSGDGINTVCQQSRFADPDGLSAIVREFRTRGRVRRTAVQTLEVSESVSQARDSFTTALGWYAGCRVGRLQLLRAYRVDGVGDEASVLTMRAWQRPVTTYTVAVGRIGTVVTTTVGTHVAVAPPRTREVVQSLADSVSMLCTTSGVEDCASGPKFSPAPPPPSGGPPGALAVVDLPPVGGIAKPWVATEPAKADPNPAMTVCDRADFVNAGAKPARTTTYLIPEAALPPRFGLSETYGTFRTSRRAKGFLDRVRTRVARCEDRELSTKVSSPAAGRRGPHLTWATWELATEVTDNTTVRFRLGFIRFGRRAAQLTFAPSDRQDMTDGQFRAVLGRAGDRLRELR